MWRSHINIITFTIWFDQIYGVNILSRIESNEFDEYSAVFSKLLTRALRNSINYYLYNHGERNWQIISILNEKNNRLWNYMGCSRISYLFRLPVPIAKYLIPIMKRAKNENIVSSGIVIITIIIFLATKAKQKEKECTLEKFS